MPCRVRLQEKEGTYWWGTHYCFSTFNSYIFSTAAYEKSRGLSNRSSACSTVICISDGLSAARAAAFVAACSAMTLCLSFSPSECNLPTYIFHGNRHSFVCVNFERHLNFNMIMLRITMQFPFHEAQNSPTNCYWCNVCACIKHLCGQLRHIYEKNTSIGFDSTTLPTPAPAPPACPLSFFFLRILLWSQI